MTRTMGVLTKPDLNIERATQKIAIDHVTGRRSDLTLGYYIVRNRGADDISKSLEEGQKDEQAFFAREPWSTLRKTGRAGITALRSRVRELLEDLIKKEFPKLKADVVKELANLRTQREGMGLSRGSPQAQRAYLSTVCARFEEVCRDALAANYTSNTSFFGEQAVKLITQIVNMSEAFSKIMRDDGHTHAFANVYANKDANSDEVNDESQGGGGTIMSTPGCAEKELNYSLLSACKDFPDLKEINSIIDLEMAVSSNENDIMSYIKTVYSESRGLDLGTVSGLLEPVVFWS